METFPVLGPLEWHIIGYEEYRLGHNTLVEQGLTSLVPDYHDNFDWIAFNSWKLELPNSWHFGGCFEASEYWILDRNNRCWEYDYIDSPVIEHYDLPEKCEWCGKYFERGYDITDFIQQHTFCCGLHAKLHRHKTLAVWPKLQAAYQYPFRPLPADKLRMLQYFRSLPGVRSNLCRLETIDLPIVEGPKIERISDGETPKGFTAEGD